MSFSRTWQKNTVKSTSTNEEPLTRLWDTGDEQWELTRMTGQIRHWRIVSKKILSREPAVVQEQCLLLPECPVPKEAVLQHSLEGWMIDETPVEPLKQDVEQKTPISLNNIAKEVKNTPHVPRSPPSSNQYDHGQHQLSDQVSQAKAVLPPSCILPMELWSSLSQWIPPSALYQPSLHLLAASELSEGPLRPSGGLKVPGPYSHTGPTRHQRGERGLRTMHGNPKHALQHSLIHGEVQRSLFV